MRYNDNSPDWGDILILLVFLFLGRLTISFVEAKLTGAFTTSWLWVFAPIWIPAGGIVLAAFIYGVCAAIAEYREDHDEERRGLGE